MCEIGTIPACDQRPVVGAKTGQAAERRRNTHRAARVRSDAARRKPRGDRYADTATRCTWNAIGRVWIARRAEGGVVVGDAVSEFVQIAFAEHDGAGVEQRLDDHRVALGSVAGKAGRAAGGRIIGGVEIVLERQRHAVQWADRGARSPALIGLPRRRAHFIGLERDECVQA